MNNNEVRERSHDPVILKTNNFIIRPVQNIQKIWELTTLSQPISLASDKNMELSGKLTE